MIEPLRIVDHTQQWTLLRDHREQAQHGQSDEEPIRRATVAQTEHNLDRPPLWGRKLLDPVEERSAHLMEAGEGQLHLRLHPDRMNHVQIRRRRHQVVEQCRLPDPSLASQH